MSGFVPWGHGDAEAARAELVDLVAEIRAECDAAEADYRSAVQHAMRAGELLTQAKDTLPHGAWLPWLRDNFELSQQTASEYMRLFSNYGTSRNLPPSINAALKQIAKPPKTQSRPEPSAQRPPVHDKREPEIIALPASAVVEEAMPTGTADRSIATPTTEVASPHRHCPTCRCQEEAEQQRWADELADRYATDPDLFGEAA